MRGSGIELLTLYQEHEIRFGIVGCGAIGLKRFAALPQGSLVVACDSSIEKAEALKKRAGGQCVAVQHIDDLIGTRPTAVVVSTTNASLAAVAAVCIRAGIHVLVEKPVGMTVAEIQVLQTLAKESGALVRAGYNHRFHPAIRKAREIFDSGALGELMFVRGRYGHGGRLGYDREWRADPQFSGGGELIDQGVHLIDLSSWFLGPWTSVAGRIATYFWDMTVEDNAFLQLENRAGNVAWLHVSCTEWKNLFSLEIYGKRAKLHVEGLGGSYGVERLYYYRMLPEMGPPETTVFEYPRGDDSWTLETREFIKDVRLGRTPVPGLREAAQALEVVETVYKQEHAHKSMVLTQI